MEWWTGGFTARAPFIKAIEETGAKPWDLIREHQYATVHPEPEPEPEPEPAPEPGPEPEPDPDPGR